MTASKINITKLAAAEHQLRAAIRLYFVAEEELAIHTIASAVYQILKDLKAKRGMNEAEDVVLASIFYVIRDYRRGTLPQEMTSDSDLMVWVRDLAEKLPIKDDAKIENVKIDLPRETITEFWKKRNKIGNFLKHADRDSSSSIPLDEVDNLMLLLQCLNSYIDLTHDMLGNEGLVFQLYMGTYQEDQINPGSLNNELQKKLSGAPEAERRHLCSFFLTELNKSCPTR